MEWKAILSNGEEINRKDVYEPNSMLPWKKVLKYTLEQNLQVYNIFIKGRGLDFYIYSYDDKHDKPERFYIETTEDWSFNQGLGNSKMEESFLVVSYCVNDTRVFLKISEKDGKFYTFTKTGVEDKYKGLYEQIHN